MEKIERRVNKIVKKYVPRMSLYKDFAFSVKRIVDEIIKKEGLDKYVQIITAREKSVVGLSKKLLNKKFKDNPEKITYLEKKGIEKFSDVKDLAGVRVILYFKGDILKKLRMALQEEFDYSSKEEQKHSDTDGQESIHSWIKFNNKRLELSEYSRYKDLKCEIQLVTILQHTWSELEHDIVYKPHDGWEKTEIEKFNDMFKEAKGYIKKASDVFESIMYIHQNEDKFLLFDNFNELDNNKLYEYLDRLKVYMEKNYLGNDVVLKGLLEKIEKIMVLASTNKIVKEKNIFGDLDGKTFKNILLKVLEILNDSRIKYSSEDNFKRIFELVTSWSNILEKDVDRKEINDFFERLSQYDLQVLKQIGPFSQKMIIDIISKWSDEDKTKNMQIIKTVVKKILQPSFESRVWIKRNEIQYSSGSLVEDKKGNLKKIRRKAISLVFDIYDLTNDSKEKLDLVRVLDEASRTPHSGASEPLEKIIIEDVDYLVIEYKRIIFNKKGKVVCGLPVAMEIERQLLWFKKRWAEKEIKDIDDFIAKLKKDKKYFIYSQLVDKTRLDYLKNSEKEVKKNDLSKKIVANKRGLGILNDITKASKTEDGWKFNDFHAFLTDLTEKDYTKGGYFLKDALKNNTELLNFADAFVVGFRNIDRLDLWDKYVAEIEKKKDGNLMSKVLHSFCFHFKNTKEAKFRKKDFSWLKSITSRKGKYIFLSKDGYNKFDLNRILFRSIILMWRYNQEESEDLLIDEIRKVDVDNLAQKIDDIELYSSWNDIDIRGWKKESIEFLVDCIIRTSTIGYCGEKLAIKIGEIKFNYLLEIIKGRLDLSDKSRKSSEYYDAIPTHLDEEFISFIIQNREKFKKSLVSWIAKKKIESFNAYECGSLLRSLGNIYSEIVIDIVKKDKYEYFVRAVGLLRSFNGVDLNLAFDVADYIINSKNIISKEKEKLLNYVGGQMYSTGMVSGEHGISEGHKRRVVEISKIKMGMEVNKKHKRLIKFANDRIKYLQYQAERERIEEDRQFKMMEIDFDS